MCQCRGFIFTTFAPPEDSDDAGYPKPDFEDSVECAYMIYGREIAPDTGSKHLQGFVYFKSPRSFASVQKQFTPRHVEKSCAPISAIEYSKKEGNFVERGICPEFRAKVRSEKGARASKENFRDFIAMSRVGDFEGLADKHPGLFVNHYRTMFGIKKDFAPAPPSLSVLDNYWFWGPPGTGKSHRARTMFGDRPVFVKGPTKWWDSYNGEEIVVIDDLGAQHEWMVDYLKVWADKYAFNAETKGGSMRIRPKIVVVTSNRSIHEMFNEKYSIDVGPLLRRFKEDYMSIPYYDPSDAPSDPSLDPLEFQFPNSQSLPSYP